MADLDFGGQSGEAVAAVLALAALHETGIAQFAKDRVKEFLGNVVRNRNVVDESELTRRKPSQGGRAPSVRICPFW